MPKCQKRPMHTAKETDLYGKRGLLTLAYLCPPSSPGPAPFNSCTHARGGKYIYIYIEREKERERERETDKQTDRQRDRERERERQTDTQP